MGMPEKKIKITSLNKWEYREIWPRNNSTGTVCAQQLMNGVQGLQKGPEPIAPVKAEQNMLHGALLLQVNFTVVTQFKTTVKVNQNLMTALWSVKDNMENA